MAGNLRPDDRVSVTIKIPEDGSEIVRSGTVRSWGHFDDDGRVFIRLDDGSVIYDLDAEDIVVTKK